MNLNRFLFFVLSLSILTVSGTASAGNTVPDGKPLPAWETQGEKALRELYGFPQPDSVDTPPTGDVESYAEWAPASGVIVAWMGFESFLTEMVREFVQVGTGWIVVETLSQQTSVENHLVNEGISLDNVEFLVFNMDSVWMVDYGPFFVQVDGDREIIDHIYDRYGRWNDDEFPENLAGAWSLPFYTSDLRIEGGNFIADGAGVCFVTDRVIEQNEGYLTEAEVYDRLQTYCGCDTVHVLDRLNDGTGHIDMFAKLLDADTMLMGQYDPGDPEYQTLEDNAALVESLVASTGEYYEVVRIPMPGNPGAYWTYTNSIIVNDNVYVPTYNDPLDPTALSIYQGAMPGYAIIGIDASSVIGSGGAVHCTTKVVPTDAEYNANVADVSIDDSTGDADGILDPGETANLIISLQNAGIYELTGVSGTLTCQETQYVSIPVANALWPDIPSPGSASCLSPYFQVVIDSNTPENTELHFDLEVTADNYSELESFTLNVSSIGVVMAWNLDTDPGWTISGGQWAYGQPLGQGGSHGSPDPGSGYTGNNVYGYNLAGDYANSIPEYHLTTTALDFSDIQGSLLKFQRWLGVEQPSYDHAYIRISNDGTTWHDVWTNTSEVSDSNWILMEYDISQWADAESTVYIRWTMGTTDSMWAFCGWNIDDIEIWGVSTAVQPTATPNPCVHHGDVNFNGGVTAEDAQMAFLIALGSYTPTYEESCAADCNGDDTVTAGDAQLIFQTALGIGNCVDPLL